MKINPTTDQWNNETHTGPVFPGADDRRYSYQGERVLTSVTLEVSGWPPDRAAGKLNHDQPDSKYSRYRLTIERFTGTALDIRLVGVRKDIVEQRKEAGRAVTEDILQTSMQFGELCNLIFGGRPIVSVFHEREAFPESVAEAMKKAYP